MRDVTHALACAVAEQGLAPEEAASSCGVSIDMAKRHLVAAAIGACCHNEITVQAAADRFGVPVSALRTPSVLVEICQRLLPLSMAKIAKRIGVPRQRLLAAARAARLHYRNRRPARDEISRAMRAVTRQGLSIRQAAGATQLSRSSIGRYVQRRREQIADSAGALVISRRQWNCPRHGPITVFPCVACAAKAARDAAR